MVAESEVKEKIAFASSQQVPTTISHTIAHLVTFGNIIMNKSDDGAQEQQNYRRPVKRQVRTARIGSRAVGFTQVNTSCGHASPNEVLQWHRGQDIVSSASIIVQSIEQLLQDYLLATPPER